jgi:hypothetical protein
LARWRCNAAMATAFNLPSEMWRSRPSCIPADMKAEVMASAVSRALLGGRHAQSMWVKAEQSNLSATSAGCAMAGVMAASRDRAAANTGFIITSPCIRNPTTQRIYDDIVRLRVRSTEVFSVARFPHTWDFGSQSPQARTGAPIHHPGSSSISRAVSVVSLIRRGSIRGADNWSCCQRREPSPRTFPRRSPSLSAWRNDSSDKLWRGARAGLRHGARG